MRSATAVAGAALFAACSEGPRDSQLEPMHQPVRVFADASLLVPPRVLITTPPRTGVRRDTTAFVRWERVTGRADTLGRFAGNAIYVLTDDAQPPRWALFHEIPFSTGTLAALSRDAVAPCQRGADLLPRPCVRDAAGDHVP